MVLGFQVEQVVDLIWKVAYPVELLVEQWVGLGGHAFEILMVPMQIGLDWVALVKSGLG